MAGSPKKMLFIGDSLVEFFDWQGRFPGHEAVNCGKAGETLGELLLRAGNLIEEHRRADFVFIMSGINDVAMEETALFLERYRLIVSKLASAFRGARLFVTSLLPTELPWVSNEDIAGLNAALKGLAEEEGAGFMDVFSLFAGRDGRPLKGLLLSDGVHLNPEGYALWSGAVEKIIKG